MEEVLLPCKSRVTRAFSLVLDEDISAQTRSTLAPKVVPGHIFVLCRARLKEALHCFALLQAHTAARLRKKLAGATAVVRSLFGTSEKQVRVKRVPLHSSQEAGGCNVCGALPVGHIRKVRLHFVPSHAFQAPIPRPHAKT
eukprot:1160217-Pelagomonas_calceolata.AAC.15